MGKTVFAELVDEMTRHTQKHKKTIFLEVLKSKKSFTAHYPRCLAFKNRKIMRHAKKQGSVACIFKKKKKVNRNRP